MNLTKPNILCALCALVISPYAASDTRFALPRAAQGIEVLLGAGLAYDKTAFIGEEEDPPYTPVFALMTKHFYLDIHEVSYRKSLSESLDIKVFGTQDGIPTSGDDPEYTDLLSIKSGDSFDLGLFIEKEIGYLNVGALIAADVTGTHNGYKMELSAEKVVSYKRSRLGLTIGGRYNDNKRSNYYYGVAPDEALPDIPEYRVDEDVEFFANATFAYQYTNNLGMMIDVGISSISDQAKESPRIDSDANIAEVEAFVGVIWQFSVYQQ